MLLYGTIKLLLRAALEIFFDNIEVRNPRNIPDKGPVIFTANHPSSIMDALIIGVQIPRKINYVGHAGLFTGRLKSKFMRSAGVIPVYRKEDSPGMMDKNVNMFRATTEALSEGECIGIFPEGTSQTDRKVLKLKTGAARMALGAEKAHEYSLGVKIVPLGLYFSHRERFRSDVLLNFGRPIEMTEYNELHREDEYEAVHRLTDRIADDLARLTLHIRENDIDSLVRDLDYIYREELKEDLRESELLKTEDGVFTDMFLTQQIADAAMYYSEHSPETVEEISKEVKNYRKKIERFRLRDSMLKTGSVKAKMTRRGGKVAFWSAVGFPLWFAGILTNYIPYKIAEQLGKKIGYDKTKTSSALLIGGGMGFIIYYALETLLVWELTNPLIGSIFLLSLPFLGFGALAYRRKVRQRWRMWNFSLLLLTNRQIVGRLKTERRELIRKINRLKEDYMKVLGQSS